MAMMLSCISCEASRVGPQLPHRRRKSDHAALIRQAPRQAGRAGPREQGPAADRVRIEARRTGTRVDARRRGAAGLERSKN